MMQQIEEILPSIFKIEVPLRGNPLKSINSYLIKGNGRNLIIDTGMNTDECYTALTSALRLLDVDLGKTDFFITHLHVDHMGLLFRLARDSSVVYFNRPDLEMMKSARFWGRASAFVSKHGFPGEELRDAVGRHPAHNFKLEDETIFTLLGEGDTLEIGNYLFRCLETPGHTKGSMCLYEPREKILFSGDHILEDITPHISVNTPMDYNPLKNYLFSLDKIYQMDIDLVLPGHRDVFVNCRQRIRELRNHHRQRMNEIIGVLEKNPENAYRIASEMSWDLQETWERFPAVQKWFAISEALAHLKDMEEEGLVTPKKSGEVFIYHKRRAK